MPKFLGQWFAYCLLIGLLVAYLACTPSPFGAHYRARVSGGRLPTPFLAYGVAAAISNSIWKGQTWSMTIKEWSTD